MENILKIESIEKYYGNKSSLTKAINNISFHKTNAPLLKQRGICADRLTQSATIAIDYYMIKIINYTFY